MQPIQVQWTGDPQKFTGPVRGQPGVRIELDVVSIQQLGTTESRKQYDSAHLANLVTICQQQNYVVSFRCDSWSFDTPSHDTLTQMHLRLRRASTVSALNDMGISMGLSHHIVDLDMVADNRPIYSSVVDYEFNFVAAETDETDSGGIIQYVNANPAALDPNHPVGDIPDIPPMDPILGTQ